QQRHPGKLHFRPRSLHRHPLRHARGRHEPHRGELRMTKIAYVSTYVPERCGLATYTHHLRMAVHEVKGRKAKDPVVVLTRDPSRHEQDPLLWPLRRDDDDAYGKMRSEEHTSELQSRENLVCRLLLEKKK